MNMAQQLIQEGRQEGRQETDERVVRTMLSLGMARGLIRQVTGLDETELDRLVPGGVAPP